MLKGDSAVSQRPHQCIQNIAVEYICIWEDSLDTLLSKYFVVLVLFPKTISS